MALDTTCRLIQTTQTHTSMEQIKPHVKLVMVSRERKRVGDLERERREKKREG